MLIILIMMTMTGGDGGKDVARKHDVNHYKKRKKGIIGIIVIVGNVM